MSCPRSSTCKVKHHLWCCPSSPCSAGMRQAAGCLHASLHVRADECRDSCREEEDAALDAVPTKASGIQLPTPPAQAVPAAGEKRRNRWDQSGDT